MKKLREGVYTHDEAERAAGMGSYKTPPPQDVQTQRAKDASIDDDTGT